jgi:hypothetical protein
MDQGMLHPAIEERLRREDSMNVGTYRDANRLRLRLRLRLRSRIASGVMLVTVGVLGSTACAISHPYGADPQKSKSGLAKDRGTESSDSGPVIAKIDPTSVGASASPHDLALTVNGTGFTTGSQVAIDGTAIPTTFGSATQLKATIPAEKLKSAGALKLTVIGDTALSNLVSLTVSDGSAGALSALNPASAPAKAASDTSQLALDVTGSAFDQSSVVVFNGTPVATQLTNATTLHAAVPANLLANAGDVSVCVTGGAHVTSPLQFHISAASGGSSGSGGGGGNDICSGALTCGEVGLMVGDCATLSDGSVAQCEQDGCLYQGCL